MVSVVGVASLVAAICSVFPKAPFTSSGRWIRDSEGAIFTYTGVNWPGHIETMVPEGLQYQSIASIVSKIKGAGFNIIRFTFAVQMIDEIYENNGTDIPISTAFTNVLGAENGTRILNQVLTLNPSFTANTTRLEVFDAVAAECAKQEIYVHLDNHISKARWCCGYWDGNGWFHDTDFDVGNWTRGLSYMAKHAAKWSSFVSIGLRNELRPALDDPVVAGTYNWEVWYENMISAADAVHAANPDCLIFFGGINSDLTLTPIPTGNDLGNGTRFNRSALAYADKAVLELHKYNNNDFSCDFLKNFEYNSGFNALDVKNESIANVMPVLMTEFGYGQTNSTDDLQSLYSTCIREFLIEQKAGWMVWQISGSLYIRDGTQDQDETYGKFYILPRLDLQGA